MLEESQAVRTTTTTTIHIHHQPVQDGVGGHHSVVHICESFGWAIHHAIRPSCGLATASSRSLG